MRISYQKAYFLLSVANIKQLPPDEGIEIAFVGRSNSGKSSVLNRLAGIKQLARVSKIPGRTQHINIFVIDEKRRLADLPGYGFAKATLRAKEQWQQTIDQYIRIRKSLRGMVVVMDIRHPLTPLDQQLLAYAHDQELAVHILLNKADKLSQSAAHIKKGQVMAQLSIQNHLVSCQLFSALKRMGVEELRKKLDDWYQ